MTTIARLLAALVAFCLVAGIAVFACLKFFSKDSMNYLAVGAIVLGLVAAAACWRSTRNWGPRSATPAEMASGFDVHLGYPYLTFLAVMGVMTFGLILPPFWIQTRRYPRRLDPDGMTLRNGRRVRWGDVTGVTQFVKRLGGVSVNKSWELCAGEVKVLILPNALAEGEGVKEFLAAHLDLMTFGLP